MAKDSTTSGQLLVKEAISEQIGVEPEDIENTNGLLEDLHISAVDFTELLEKIQEKGIPVDTDTLNLKDIVTVEDLMNELDIDIEI